MTVGNKSRKLEQQPMKARFFKIISLGLVLSALPLVGGCNQQSSNSPQSLISTAQAEPALVAASSSNALPATPVAPEATPPPADGAPVPVPAPTVGKAAPPNIKLSGTVGEVVKLTQAGVDESVMLDFVRNSTSLFSLGSDEIIYFNDIGTPASVVTAMLEHDQALRQARAEATQAEAAAAQTTTAIAQGAAPTYSNPPPPETPPPASTETAEAPAAPAPVPTTVNYNYFYDSLSPYGSWISVPGYGYCWQPTVVVMNRTWRPYCDGGRWIYTDCGWYWYSDYSWGWAPFHYGRWFSDARYGWCWYPGYTWAPAWVSWRYTSGYCGWAPLSPAACYTSGIGFTYYGSSVGVSFGFGLSSSCYTFVPWGNFCGYRPYKYCAPPHQAAQIYQNSTVVNNYISGNNNTIINRGIPTDLVRRYGGKDIRPVSIRESRHLAGGGERRESLDRGGRILAVKRPNIPAPVAGDPIPPRIVRDANFGSTQAAAGAASQPSSVRGRSIDVSGRSQAGASHFATSTRRVEDRTAHQVSPGVNGISPIAQQPSAPASNRANSTSGRESISRNSNFEISRGNTRSAPVVPLATQNETSGTVESPIAATASANSSGLRSSMVNRSATQRTSPNSFVMIGRRDSKPSQNANSQMERPATPLRTQTPSRSAYYRPTTPSVHPTPTIQAQPPERSATRAPVTIPQTRTVTRTPNYQHRESSRQLAEVPRAYSVPAPAAPVSRPQYSAPVRSTPAQSAPAFVSAPRQSTPAPARSAAVSQTPSRPSPPSSTSAYSSGGTRGGRSR